MANIKAKGIIIRQSDYGEGHRLISIFAEGLGIIKAISYGAKKSKSSSAASSQLLTYGTFSLFKGSGRLMSVNGAEAEESFYPITEDIEKLALVNYLSDITYEALGENNADDAVLKLYLNTVYALSYRQENIQKIKTVYELKLMTLGGYMPSLNECESCGSETVMYFDIDSGGAVCGECRKKTAVRVNEQILSAMRYIICCDDKRMLSFSANDELISYLNNISERYVSVQLDKTFKSLDYYKSILMS